MSTKSTICYGDNFHFYKDCFDEENVYLSLETINNISIENGVVTIAIPLEIWQNIRFFDNKFEYANLSDEQINEIVTKAVEKRIENKGPISKLFGCGIFGSFDLPKEEQIKNGIDFYRKQREKEMLIVEKIKNITKYKLTQ